MSGRGVGGHQSARAEKDEWITPRDITDRLGPFDLDPCAPINPPWPVAPRTYSIADDGLSQDWGQAFVWCNPPYGQQTGVWLKKLEDHGNGIALVFARTETEMFFSHAWHAASAMLFLEGRLFFHHVDGRRARSNSGGPSVLLAYGSEAVNRLRNSGFAGCFVRSWVVLDGHRSGQRVGGVE